MRYERPKLAIAPTTNTHPNVRQKVFRCSSIFSSALVYIISITFPLPHGKVIITPLDTKRKPIAAEINGECTHIWIHIYFIFVNGIWTINHHLWNWAIIDISTKYPYLQVSTFQVLPEKVIAPNQTDLFFWQFVLGCLHWVLPLLHFYISLAASIIAYCTLV